MMGEDAVIIVDRAQKGRELALQRGDVEAGAQVPEQAGAKFLGRGAGNGEADQRIAALDRAGGEAGIGDEQLRQDRRRPGEGDPRRGQPTDLDRKSTRLNSSHKYATRITYSS